MTDEVVLHRGLSRPVVQFVVTTYTLHSTEPQPCAMRVTLITGRSVSLQWPLCRTSVLVTRTLIPHWHLHPRPHPHPHRHQPSLCAIHRWLFIVIGRGR